ncbi:hypothetical protein C8F01DRAFT_1087954 [Mycena amicta]|nr:hypothetical protein C8F01DRAFT_1087954 [Mycena amicta]
MSEGIAADWHAPSSNPFSSGSRPSELNRHAHPSSHRRSLQVCLRESRAGVRSRSPSSLVKNAEGRAAVSGVSDMYSLERYEGVENHRISKDVLLERQTTIFTSPHSYPIYDLQDGVLECGLGIRRDFAAESLRPVRGQELQGYRRGKGMRVRGWVKGGDSRWGYSGGLLSPSVLGRDWQEAFEWERRRKNGLETAPVTTCQSVLLEVLQKAEKDHKYRKYSQKYFAQDQKFQKS